MESKITLDGLLREYKEDAIRAYADERSEIVLNHPEFGDFQVWIVGGATLPNPTDSITVFVRFMFNGKQFKLSSDYKPGYNGKAFLLALVKLISSHITYEIINGAGSQDISDIVRILNR